MSEGEILSLVSGLAKGQLPQPELQRHVETLQAGAGSGLPGGEKVSSQSIERLARLSNQPSQFIQKFSSCRDRRLPELNGMINLLTGITEDQNIVRAFATGPSGEDAQIQSQPPASGANDLKTLRERLLKQVISSNASSAVPPPLSQRTITRNTAGPVQRSIFADRPYLTCNFVPDHAQAGKSNKENQYQSNIKGVPISSQESVLVHELLYCLLGNGAGPHILPVSAPVNPTGSGVTSKLTFKLDPNIDKSLRCLVERILPLCVDYSRVVAWCEGGDWGDQILGGSVEGGTNKALVSSIQVLLHDYLVLVCQLELEWKKDELSLHTLWFRLQSTMQSMDLIASLVEAISAVQARGGATLSILHEKLNHCGGNPKAKKLLCFLIENASKPFFETLSIWLHHGVIIDPTKDFFVEDHEVVDRNSLPLEYNDDYWEKRYCLRMDRIPNFLHKYSDTILRTGKYLNVIQQCDKSAEWKEVETMEYLTNPQHYSPIIEKAHAHASTTLLHLLVNDRDMIGHLRSMKKYFLMEQGDFMVQFLDLCEKELSQPVGEVQPARLESLLELALRTSSANYDQYKDNLCVALLPYDLIFQMGKIMAIYTSEEQEFLSCDTSLLSGLDAFAFGYQVEWPVSLILNHKSLAQYQMLFRHLFFCKHIERLLSSVWISNKSAKSKSVKKFRGNHLAFGLRQKMLNLIQNLSYYMMVEVIEPAWHVLLSGLSACTTVDDVLARHADFLNNCLHDCLLSSPQLLGTVKKLLGVCSEFSEYMLNLRSHQSDDFNEDMARYDLQFNSVLFSLLDRISQLGRDNYNEKVLNILHRLDFNGFYSAAIDQFKAAPASQSGNILD